MCDANQLEIYTMNGRKVCGFKVHICQKEKEKKNE